MLNMLLVHQTSSSVAQSEKTVIVLVHSITVAGEGVNEQLQLVIGSFADMNTKATKSVLQMVRTFLYVGILGNTYNQIEMGIYKLFVLSCYNILHLLDVLNSNQITWIGHTGMAVLLFVQQCQFTFLIWHEEHLVIDNHVC